MAKDDEERLNEYINEQVEKAKEQSTDDGTFEATELVKAEGEVVKLDLKVGDGLKSKLEKKPFQKNALNMKPE